MAADAAARDERSWDSDKRAFVADHRDDVASERDAAADARDRIAHEREQAANDRDCAADQRETNLDEWEARRTVIGAEDQLVTTASEERRHAATARARGGDERDEAAKSRDAALAQRTGAEADRELADERRHTSSPATGLALAFARIAAYLYEGTQVDVVFERVAEAAVSSMAGCSMASVTVREGATPPRTAAATHPQARAADLAQYEQGEGPCLDAIEQTIVYAPSFPDPRWPSLASGLRDHGVGAVGSYRLGTPNSAGAPGAGGSLNTYASEPDAYTEEAREIGVILAAHASLVTDTVRARQSLEELGEDLRKALASRDVISQAKGILMERHRLTPDDAFDVLRRASQTLNVKLKKVAEHLAETGELVATRDTATDVTSVE
jgi:hypothetical protein